MRAQGGQGEKGVVVENLSGNKVELVMGLMKKKGYKRDLRMIENTKVTGEKWDNRKEKELLGLEGTSNEHERMTKGSGGNLEELSLKEGERRIQNEKHDQKRRKNTWKYRIIGLYKRSDVIEVEQMSEEENETRKSLTALDQNVMLGLNEEKD